MKKLILSVAMAALAAGSTWAGDHHHGDGVEVDKATISIMTQGFTLGQTLGNNGDVYTATRMSGSAGVEAHDFSLNGLMQIDANDAGKQTAGTQIDGAMSMTGERVREVFLGDGYKAESLTTRVLGSGTAQGVGLNGNNPVMTELGGSGWVGMSGRGNLYSGSGTAFNVVDDAIGQAGSAFDTDVQTFVQRQIWSSGN